MPRGRYTRFAWVNPSEVLAGVHLTRAVGYPHGAFVYAISPLILPLVTRGMHSAARAVYEWSSGLSLLTTPC